MKKTGSKILHGMLLATSGLVASTVVASTAAVAGGGPTGGTVVVGHASIVNASPTQTVVNQSSKKALINWNSFSIPADSSVKFNQPTRKSLAVNRVTGPNASTIDGQLLANGNIWLINANGVLFGKGSQINVGALLATTSDINDGDFQNGNYTFQPAANPNAAVVNKGTIVVNGGGSAILSAPHVSNEGLIQADLGTVVLGGAKAFTVDMDGDNLLRYEITAPVDAPSTNGVAAALVSNSGAIEANGGQVTMTARAAQSVRDNVINNTGMVEANTVSVHNGEIDLDAGPDGGVNVGGTLSATGNAPGQTGGAVNVTGGAVNVADGAKIDVSGASGGGAVQIGGGLHGQGALAHAQSTTIGKATIVADATSKGDGGTVAVWSDGQTSFAGSISAKGGAQGGNGGQVETSGHTLGVAASAKVDTSAPLGLSGDWLLDPATINIVTSSGISLPSNGTLGVNDDSGQTDSIDPQTIIDALNSTDVTLEASTAINVENAVNYTSLHALNLLSEGSINVSASIQNAGTGNVTLVAGWDGTTPNFSQSMASSIYGQNSGGIVFSGPGNVTVGSLGGQTLVAGYNINLSVSSGDAQIGYHGVGGGGNIAVLAAGNLTLAGGEGFNAVIGNGILGGQNPGIATGDIYIDVVGYTNASSSAYIGNSAGPSSTETGNVTLITGGGDFAGSYFVNDLSGGDVFLGLTQTGDFSLPIGDYDSSHTFTWAVAGSANVTGDIVNSGTGNVNIIAGWDGTTTDLSALTNMDVANATTYGQNGGNVTITAGQAGFTSVGSAGGKTTVAGEMVMVGASSGPAQIGIRGEGGGDIAVYATGDVYVGDGVAGGSAQIGNGGSPNVADTGNITVIAVGDVSLTGGEGAGYAQIGNGGFDLQADASGDISVTAGGDITLQGGQWTFGSPSLDAYAQIGNGGDSFVGTVSGNVAVHAGGNVALFGGVENSYAQIGNGGVQNPDLVDLPSSIDTSGDITVSADGSITLKGGDSNAYAQIGNGGAVVEGVPSAGSATGNISVTAGSDIDSVGVALTGGAGDYAYAQIGNGGDSATSANSGDIVVNATGSIRLSGDTDYAQIGNGGWGSTQDSSGNITVTSGAGADVTVSGGSGSYGFAQIGNGGYEASGTTNGTISISAGKDVILMAGTGSSDYAQIGNGGDSSSNTNSGDIVVNANGSISLTGEGGYAQIGNGGNVSQASSGNITVTAGTDITLTGEGYYAQIGNGGENLEGDTSGDINVTAGGNISLNGSLDSGENDRDYAQIGNGGQVPTDPNAAGDITVFAGGDLNMTGGEGGYAQIGNGAGTFFGDVSGNISVNVTGTTTFATNDNAVWIGNLTGEGDESGDVSIITGDFNLDNDNVDTIGNFVSNDIMGGNVTLGVTSSSSSYTIDNGVTYNSPYALTLLTAGGIDITGQLQNTGTGNITLVAGWNPSVAPSNVLTTAGAYGNNDALITIGGVSCGTNNAAVGSAGGKTTVLTDMLTVDSENGYAQIGYHGAGGGNIDARATGLVSLIANDANATASIGNGGIDISGNITGNVSVMSASQGIMLATTSDSAIAGIGNIGGAGSSQSGNITVNTNGGLLTLVATNPGGYKSFATIGNFAKGDTTGTSSGNIAINAGQVLLSSTGGASFTHIGNGDFHAGNNTGALSGNISLIASSLTMVALGDDNSLDQARIGNLGSGLVNGNVNVAVSGDISLLSDGLSLASIGGVSVPVDSNDNPLPALGSENITVQSGGAISLLAENGASARIETDLAGNITVTSAGNISLTSNGGPGAAGGSATIIGGILSSGTVNVSVTSTSGAIDLEAYDPESTALIGNIASDPASAVGGNISVSAANATNGAVTVAAHGSNATAQIGNNGAGFSIPVSGNVRVTSGGNLTVLADGANSTANLGNLGGDGSSQSGDITVSAGKLLSVNALATSSNAQIGNLEVDGTAPASYGNASGNITVTAASTSILARGTNTAAQIGNGNSLLYNNAISGNIVLNTGNLTLSSNATSASSVSFARIGARGRGNEAGNITITAGNVSLAGGTAGNTIIGHGSLSGSASGNVGLNASGFVDLEATGQAAQSRIGNAGASSAGNLTVVAGGGVTLDAVGQGSTAHIANFGAGANSGNIAVTSKTGNILLAAVGANSVARIGLQTTGASSTASGNIVVSAQAGSIDLAASGSGSDVQIGNGFGDDSSVTGNITLAAAQNIVLNTTVSNADLQIGSNGSANVTGNIAVTAGGNITLDAPSDSQTLIGNSATGSYGGNVVITAQSIDGIGASAFNDIVGGDFTMNSLGTNTINIDNAGTYDSSHNFALNTGGDILFENSLENTGTGNMTVNAAGTVTIGGSGAASGVALGSKGGLTQVSAGNLVLTATNGFAQLGYHGAGSGAIVAAVSGDVTLTGGGGTGYYAQIGAGGYQVSGSSSAPITVTAGGNVTLNAGAGQEAYAQIGNGGAESNTGSTGYSETGLVTVSGQSVLLNAGTGAGSYAQIGHGGYKSGQSLNGVATLSGDISVAATDAVRLNGGGADAYAQIGNGGDFLNYQVADGSSGSISGAIAVAVSNPVGPGDPVTLTAGSGANSYAQIGNGGQGENMPAAGANVTFTIGGNVVVSDLTLTGSNTGANGYAQLGNGDASKTGTGNVSGNVTLGQGTNLTIISGKAPGASAGFGNATGFGSVTGTIPSNGINDPGTIGTVATITQNNVNPINGFSITTVTVTPIVTPGFEFGSDTSQGPSPLEQLADSSNSEGTQPSDSVSQSVGQSLDNGKTIYVTSQTIIPGVLKQFMTLNANSPHGVPPADEDYSSWGNEALWRW